mmetsp:Transcript_204/g.540  ORF Transcript_204/g.540 Transcript_204/m.540 type:complete len:812 (-) Transcript_204:130-2565(-)
MASWLPASPSLSPGRQVVRSGPQSPALGCRSALPSSSANSASVAPAIAARHSKSASELAKDQLPQGGHSACPSKQQVPPSEATPIRIVAGSGTYAVAQSGMTMPILASDSMGSASGQANGVRLGEPFGGITQRPYTPKVPGLADTGTTALNVLPQRSASPNGVTVAPCRQTTTPAAVGSQYAAVRGNSVERRAPQWAAASPWSKVSALPLEPQASQQQTGVAAGGVKLWANGSTSSWVSPRKSTGASNATASQNRSWSRISQGRRMVNLDVVRPADSLSALAPTTQPPAQMAVQPADRLLERSNAQSTQLQPASRRAPSHPHLQGSTPQQNGLGIAVPQDEVQVASLRNSLLQHIRSVQKEITKLQQERQKAQQGNMDRQVSGARPTDVQVDSNVAVSTLSKPSASHAVPAERSGDRPIEQPSRAVAEHTAASLSAPVISTAPRDASTVVAHDQVLQRSHALPAARSGSSAAARAAQPVPRQQPQRTFVAKHYAACRIQRAWKIHHWRRLFLTFSESSAGWVGTLDWLQRHCLLYGTELADPEDIRFWNQQRAGAPLDREVDPWGCSKLRDHLNKMWYGTSVEELLPQAQHAHQQLQPCYSSEREHRNGQAGRAVHEAALGNVALRSSLGDPRLLDVRQAASGLAPSLKATSISPRREAQLARRDLNSRAKGHILTAAQAAVQQSPPQMYRSPRAAAVPAQVRPQSPVQSATASAGPIMRQRSPVRQAQVQAVPASGRLSLPGLPAYQQQGGSVTVTSLQQSAAAAPLSAGVKARPVAGGSLAVSPQGRPAAGSPPSFAARLHVGASTSRR